MADNYKVSFRISVQEARPDADLYNYDFKEKWENGVKEAGINESHKLNIKNLGFATITNSKYDKVDKEWIDIKSNYYFSNSKYKEDF